MRERGRERENGEGEGEREREGLSGRVPAVMHKVPDPCRRVVSLLTALFIHFQLSYAVDKFK